MNRTKKICFLLFAWSVMAIGATAQTIQYSRQTFRTPDADAMQLVANISGYHHVVCFTAGEKPLVYIFDTKLQLYLQKEIEYKLQENCDVKIIPFLDYYYLYLHVSGSFLHQLWKVDGVGNTTPLSATFQKFVDKEINKHSTTLQLSNQRQQLFVLSHTYYEPIKKLGSTVALLDTTLVVLSKQTVFSPFNKEDAMLQQAIVMGKYVYLLTSVTNDELGNSLDVVKANLTTGESITNSFKSGSHMYSGPAFSFNPSDSTLLVSALIREPINSIRWQRTIFISRLDHLLQEKAPINLLKAQFRNSTISNFLLMPGHSVQWLNMTINTGMRRGTSRSNVLRQLEAEDNSIFNLARSNIPLPEFYTDYRQPAGIRFTLLNQYGGIITDSLVNNKQHALGIQARPFGQVTIKNKNYLVLIENFSAKHRGLIVITDNGKRKLLTTDIPVFDRYEYLLAQLQPVDNDYFILPYLYKREIGLVKIRLE